MTKPKSLSLPTPSRRTSALYASNFTSWIETIQTNDRARYYLFAFTCTIPHTLVRFRNAFRTICEESSRAIFTDLSKSHPERHPVEKSIAIILLPATSAANLVHYHGWMRIPQLAIDAGESSDVPFVISQHGTARTIWGPTALKLLTTRIIRQFVSSTPFSKSLWIAYAPDASGRDVAVDDATDEQHRREMFSYLTNTRDGEQRHWDQALFIPQLVFKRITPNLPLTE